MNHNINNDVINYLNNYIRNYFKNLFNNNRFIYSHKKSEISLLIPNPFYINGNEYTYKIENSGIIIENSEWNFKLDYDMYIDTYPLKGKDEYEQKYREIYYDKREINKKKKKINEINSFKKKIYNEIIPNLNLTKSKWNSHCRDINKKKKNNNYKKTLFEYEIHDDRKNIEKIINKKIMNVYENKDINTIFDKNKEEHLYIYFAVANIIQSLDNYLIFFEESIEYIKKNPFILNKKLKCIYGFNPHIFLDISGVKDENFKEVYRIKDYNICAFDNLSKKNSYAYSLQLANDNKWNIFPIYNR